MADINLTECQRNGLLKVKMSKKHIVICGAAGTGKTFLLKRLLDTIGSEKNIVYCAPTHQAKQVLAETVGVDAFTIHSLLKIHPETYEDQMDFGQSGSPELEEVDVLVLDEASMLDRELFEIMMNSIPRKCLIIALGDPYQIQPVRNAPGIISPIFFDDRFERVILKEIVRQSEGNPIIQVATAIRKEGASIHQMIGDNGEGVFKHDNLSSFMKEYFSVVKTPEDTLTCKILSYTNGVVDDFNGLIRKRLYNTEEPVVQGEYLVMQEPVYHKMEHKGISISEIKFHNGQTVKVREIFDGKELQDVFSLPEVPHLDPVTVKFYRLICESIDDDVVYPIDVIYDEESASDLSYYLHCAAVHYKKIRPSIPAFKMKSHWREFWKIKERFKEVKGSAACTFHKSQGSTFNRAFIITAKLDLADPKIRRQLEYVGTTRARFRVDFV